MELWLIRHGMTPGNEEKRYIGRTDEGLSGRGREELAGISAYPEVDLLFSSPMRRCIETGEILFPGKEPRIIRDLREIDFGEFEGRNYNDLSGNPAYQAWIDSGGTLSFPGGEDRDGFLERCLRGYGQMMEQIGKEVPKMVQGKELVRVACVVHGGTIMAILSHYLGGNYFDYQIANGEGYAVRLEETEGSLQMVEAKRIRLTA